MIIVPQEIYTNTRDAHVSLDHVRCFLSNGHAMGITRGVPPRSTNNRHAGFPRPVCRVQRTLDKGGVRYDFDENVVAYRLNWIGHGYALKEILRNEFLRPLEPSLHTVCEYSTDRQITRFIDREINVHDGV